MTKVNGVMKDEVNLNALNVALVDYKFRVNLFVGVMLKTIAVRLSAFRPGSQMRLKMGIK